MVKSDDSRRIFFFNDSCSLTCFDILRGDFKSEIFFLIHKSVILTEAVIEYFGNAKRLRDYLEHLAHFSGKKNEVQRKSDS